MPPSKRSSVESEDETALKRSKVSQGKEVVNEVVNEDVNGDVNEDVDEDVDEVVNAGKSVCVNETEHQVRAGYVEKIFMTNFMCHTKLEVNLNESINFIVGRNGSGKSAILSAVVIALGGNASSTNRASSLKDFIRNGANVSCVEVTITNIGLFAYKPDVYGPRIVVQRRLYSGSSPSAYKIMSAKGEVISTKREELKKIVTALNIQVDNPISVLNQDTARTFLATSDIKSKYNLFMKATRLEDVDQLHATTLVYESNAQNRLQLRKESLKQQEKEIKDLEKKANALNKLREIQKRSVDLENEYFWALARDEEKVLKDIENKIDKENEKSETLTSALKQRQESLEEARKELSETQNACQEMNTKLREAERQVSNAKQDSQKIYLEYKSSLKDYSSLTKEFDQIRRDIASILEEMEKFNSGDSASFEQQRERMTNEQLSYKQQQEKIMATFQTTELEYTNLLGEYEHYNEQMRNLKIEKTNINHTLGQKRLQLERLRSKADNLTIFGEWMPRLVQRIEECNTKGMFVRKPIGPLGASLKVKDASWTRAIEMELGSVLRSFACHCAKDAQVLRKLFSEVVKGARHPGILVSKFTDKLHHIENSCARTSQHGNIFDMLSIQNVNAANFLIDNCSIEAILLIPNGKEASQMMSRNEVPNCRKSITLEGDQYFPYPDFRMYAGNPHGRTSLLQTSVEDAIRSLEGEIRAEEKNIEKIDAELNDLEGLLRNNAIQKRNVDERKRTLRLEASKLSQKITDLQNAMDDLPNSQNMITLTSEKKVLEEKAAVYLEKSKKALDASDEKKQIHVQAQKKCEELQTIAKKLYNTRQEVLVNLGNIKEKVQKKESELKDCEEIYGTYCNRLKKMKEVFEKQKEKTHKAIEDATSVCAERVISKRHIQDINNELTDCKSYESVVGKENGITPEIIDVIHDKQLKFQENVHRMRTLKRGLKILSASLESRKGLYILIRRVMSLKVSYIFKILLNQRGYKGKMTFDHDARTLEVQIAPKQEKGSRETKSLSGGERSYSTVSFILSLWECVEPPFYFMDEFDVFMDKLNRRVVINLLLIQARQSKKHQFVFLTPQDISSISSATDITIHELDDPERNKAG